MTFYLYSASRLRNGIEDWKEITPRPVRRSVEAVRRNFDEQSWKVSEIMGRACNPALRKGSTEEGQDIRLLLQQQLGHPVRSTVDDGKTEPAVFSYYFYLCADLLAGDLRRTFFNLRDISLAQCALISGSPIEWTELQVKVLIADVSYRISQWVKCTCDNLLERIGNDLEWETWRAPKWLCMHPFANPPYDRAKAWERMDATDSNHMLEVIEDRFNGRLVMELQKAVDEAHVRLTIEPHVKIKHATHSETSETREAPDRERSNFASRKPMRAKFIKPILEQNGFSIHDWAKKAGVDFHTANNYLRGKTRPFPETRKKLADAIGIKVNQLPK